MPRDTVTSRKAPGRYPIPRGSTRWPCFCLLSSSSCRRGAGSRSSRSSGGRSSGIGSCCKHLLLQRPPHRPAHRAALVLAVLVVVQELARGHAARIGAVGVLAARAVGPQLPEDAAVSADGAGAVGRHAARRVAQRVQPLLLPLVLHQALRVDRGGRGGRREVACQSSCPSSSCCCGGRGRGESCIGFITQGVAISSHRGSCRHTRSSSSSTGH